MAIFLVLPALVVLRLLVLGPLLLPGALVVAVIWWAANAGWRHHALHPPRRVS